jgi:hypothetical protein
MLSDSGVRTIRDVPRGEGVPGAGVNRRRPRLDEKESIRLAALRKSVWNTPKFVCEIARKGT